VKERILLNERYGTVEIDKTGIIIGYNKNGKLLLSDIIGETADEDLSGLSINEFSAAGEVFSINADNMQKIIFSVFSSLNGILLIDTIYYKEAESVVVRFVRDNEVFAPFLNLIKNSLSIYIELDDKLNIIFATDSFCKLAGIEKYKLYGENISEFADSQNLKKISSAADLFKKNIINFLKIDEVQFRLNNIDQIFDMEVTTVKEGISGFSGILCQLLDKSFEKKSTKMGKTIRRMSAVANFAGGIAHDYNNALTAVLGNISLAKMDAEKDSELDELLRDAESAGLKIKTLTERLGLFARGMKPAKNKTDIKKLIEDVLPETLSGYKGNFKINIQENMINPEIDAELISEAFRHVLENAVDAVDKPDGEIVICAEEIEVKEESVFRETTLVSGKYILISIKDNGPGIDQSFSRDIFDPYITTKIGREGLGLALAYTIIKRHRGFICGESSANNGAEFKIFIPLF